MPVLTTIAATLVLLAGGYLLALGATCVIHPVRARRFLGAFASSRPAHLLELALRLTVGVAVLLYAPHMEFTRFFRIAGWVLVSTTLVLLALPWRWHHRFATWSVPLATRRLWLLSAGSLAFGAFVVVAVLLGSGT